MDTQPNEKEVSAAPSVHRNASWGAVISIVIIMAMVVVGAFYAWGKRIDETRSPTPSATISTTTVTNQ